MIIDELTIKDHKDGFYPHLNPAAAEGNYCPECGNNKIYKLGNHEFYCKKCDCQWSE
jgi:hypothetical protein